MPTDPAAIARRLSPAQRRALPDISVCTRGACHWNGAYSADSLAAAVEAAAEGGADG